jgi:sporulation protein YlmC with PRC-barrel domain
MSKITNTFLSIMVASLALTARSDDNQSQAQQSSNDRKQSAQSSGQEKAQVSQEQRNQQSTFQPGQISDSQLKKTVTEVNKASAFIGMAVKNMQNENLGKVHDLVFDPESAKISYAVLSIGGLLGVGDKLVAVPVNSLKPQPGQKYLMLNMDKNQVQSAPGLAQNNWPDLDSPGIGAAAGSESATSSASGSSPSSASESSSSQPQSKDSTRSDRSKSNSDSSAANSSDSASSANSRDSSKSKSDSDSTKDQ